MLETALQDGELIIGCRFNVPERAAYVKFCNPVSRYAIVGVFVASFDDQLRVAVAPCVHRVAEMERALARRFSADSIAPISIDPQQLNEDPHATAAYRAHLVNVLAQRAVARSMNPGT